MENKNYGEIFCQATEILAQHLIEKVSFDRTILCTIIDDSDKNSGKYRVQNAETIFDAYSSDTTYKKNDNVYVSIPGGDWNEQKIIVSKKVEGAQTAINYVDPYETFVNITNNIIPNNDLSSGLIANDEKETILLWQYNGDNSQALCKNNGKEFVGYSRLAIQASFLTLLKSLDVKVGEYGLDLCIEIASEDSEDIKTKICRLSCEDMIGNPYNYETYFPQTKIFNIEDFEKIVGMKLYFFQQKGSFKNIKGEIISSLNTPNNILTKDIVISLGYDAQQFDNDTLILYSLDSKKYDITLSPLEDNHKKIEVRWVHKFEDGRIKVVDENDNIDYNLTFYRHTLGAKSENIWSGVDWTSISTQKVENKEITYEIKDKDWKDYNYLTETSDIPIRIPEYNATWLIPDTTKAEEKIKAILTYDNEVLRSTIITFSNVDEVVNKPTIDALQALSIVCEDDTNGNYLVYRMDGKILDDAYSKIRREFKAYFNSVAEGIENGELIEAESIEWIIPADNTMITLDESNWSEEELLPEPQKDGFYHIIRKGDDNNQIQMCNNLYYTIKNSYNQTKTNNIVKCVVVRNKITYTAIKDLTFGPAGTSGTDYTFVLDFVDNKENALTIGSEKAVLVRARLYDYTGKELDIKGRTIKWKLNDETYVKTIEVIDENDKIELQLDKNLKQVPINNYTILEAVLEGWGDYKLKAYLPIPIRLNYDYQFISGATTIMYNSLGYLEDSFKNPYTIYKNNGSESIDGAWYIKSGVINDPYIPTISVSNGKYILRPINSYVENAMKQLCVFGKEKADDDEPVIWSQPIYVYQNKYPASIINDWNGELTIDNKNNAILTAKVIAGKKNNDNTFSGVMMGSWYGVDNNVEEILKENTGIYGFQGGISSFGFRDNGTAFIGKPGAGRLEFDGEKSIIQSNLMASTEAGGMKLDFNDGFIQLIQPNEILKNEIWFDAQKDSEYPIRVGKENEEKFKVAWDGSIYAEDGNFKGTIVGSKLYFGDGTGHKYIRKNDINNYIIVKEHLSQEQIDKQGLKLWEENIDLENTGSLAVDDGNDGTNPTLILQLKSNLLPLALKSEAQVLVQSFNNWVALYAGKSWDKGRVEITNEGQINLISKDKTLQNGLVIIDTDELNVKNSIIYFGEGKGYKYVKKDGSSYLVLKNTMQNADAQGYVKDPEILDLNKKGQLKIMENSDGTNTTLILGLSSEDLPLGLKTKPQILIQSEDSWVGLCTTNWKNGRVVLDKNNTLELISEKLIISSPQLSLGNENSSSVFHIHKDTNAQFDGDVTISGKTIITGITTIDNGITIKKGVTISSDGLSVTGSTSLNNGLSVTGSASISNGLTVSDGKINFSGVSANNQTGIYARFA